MNTTATQAKPTASEGHRSARRLLDDTSRSQMPRPYLLDTGPFPIRKAPAPLRMIKPAPLPAAMPASAACGFGTCALDPECTHSCRYREADEALRGHCSERHTQRAAMPPVKPRPSVNPMARRITWSLILLWCLGWTAGPVLWWLFA